MCTKIRPLLPGGLPLVGHWDHAETDQSVGLLYLTMARNITVDGLFLTPRFFGCGINRYLVCLLRQVQRLADEFRDLQVRVLVPSKREAVWHDVGGQRRGVQSVVCPAMRLRKLWRLGVFQCLPGIRVKSDVLFLPSPAPLHFKRDRLAVTVHDIIPILFPDEFRSFGGRLLRHSVLSSLKMADLILTDSNYSRVDLVSRCGVPEERVVVTHLGFDSQLFNHDRLDPTIARDVLSRHGIEGSYILHVGAIEPRKNLVRLIRAYRLLVKRQKPPVLQLVLCGRLAWGFQEVVALVREPGLQGAVVLTGSVPDNELAILYKSSIGFVMPSLYEGFGLPPLEAMACGVPVISSDRSCLPEICGHASVYFNPESEEEIADAMERLLTDSALRANLIERGLARARLFSWEDCARKTLSALKAL